MRPRPDNSIDPEGEFPLGVAEYFFYLLFQTARQRDLGFDTALQPTGLSVERWRTLAIIRRMRECSMTTLARFSTIERTTLTRAVDRLVEQGLVERWVPAKDRRQVCLALSDLGESIYADAVARLLSFNKGALDNVDSAGLRETTRLLSQVLSNAVKDETLAKELLAFGRLSPTPEP